MRILQRLLPFLVLTVMSLRADVKRAIDIQAPAEAAAGTTVAVTLSASTDAADGEQIGSLQAEYSVDEGKTWAQLHRAENSGAVLTHQASFAVSPEGGKAMVRLRVAFRGGAAGEVDYKGGAIQWNESWQEWRWPPSKYVIIHVPKPPAVASTPVVVNRMLSIEAPANAAAGSTISVTVSARTDAGDGEYISFPHVGYSVDDGKTWTQLYYEEKVGTELSRKVSFTVNPKGGKTIVRFRAAFRGGGSGDVDYRGGTLRWNDTWDNWRTPPVKYFIIYSPKS